MTPSKNVLLGSGIIDEVIGVEDNIPGILEIIEIRNPAMEMSDRMKAYLKNPPMEGGQESSKIEPSGEVTEAEVKKSSKKSKKAVENTEDPPGYKQCRMCGKIFNTVADLNWHGVVEHGGTAPESGE